MAGAVRSLAIVMTSRCNLQCRYCYRAREIGGELSWADLRSGLDWALANAGDKVEFVFTGGEPLLALPMLERAVCHASRNRRPTTEVSYQVLTNGTLMSEEAEDYLAARGCELSTPIRIYDDV